MRLEIGDGRGEIGVAGTLAVAVHAALHLRRPLAHGGERVGHSTATVVVEVGTELGGRPPANIGDDLLHLVGQHSAVRVTQDEGLGSRLLGGTDDSEGEVAVQPEAVEEVLCIEEDAQAVGAQEGDRIGRHGDRLVETRPEGVGDMEGRGFRDYADGLCAGPDEVGQHLVLVGLRAGAPRRAEGDKCGRLQVQLAGGPAEEGLVLRVGTGPAPFDVGDTQVVELLGYPQLVVDGERDPLLLGAVPQRRVVDGYGGRQPFGVTVRVGYTVM